MPIRTRVSVLKLKYGGYFSKTGTATYYLQDAVKLLPPDAEKLLKALAPIQKSDILWGVSIEWLPKRTKEPPWTPEEAHQFLVVIKTHRLLAEAARYDREAQQYLLFAKTAEEHSQKLRQKATELRQQSIAGPFV